MVETIGISQGIRNLTEVHLKFNLTRNQSSNFFTEWTDNLPDLSVQEKQTLDSLKERYLYYASDNSITEVTLNIIMISPLLELANLCDTPFKIKAEQAVKIELKDSDIILQGFIDALVIKEQFWVIVIEAKRYGFNISLAIPQALTSMMANTKQESPIFGLVTNGEDYIFIKVSHQNQQYDISDKLTLGKRNNQEFYQVFQIIKNIKQFLL
ncbi:type I restriction enzyme HsdR N-terminal domain-containing protein [Crocosphaera sp.]|uniref:type I restriction enzyme HsdR N-terminal domain-containing protein n=1 Tax=Crocosphaera sp. TaxID=2729996 RepID=UPI0026254A89|nr:type I restriction enzyme HsdR N-terminal domain-containing protein [Crocosphaera sp.]MDJ0579775.1 type I restriction enzyme HsdR N-terminal domain-containing protein [Crocosphaera sp.]